MFDELKNSPTVSEVGPVDSLTIEHRQVGLDGPDKSTTFDQSVLVEEPLAMRIDGQTYSVVMRTPGDEIPHLVGFCLGEGLIDSKKDIETAALCDDGSANVATMTLTKDRRRKVAELLNRRGFLSQTSCGICGKEIVDEIFVDLEPPVDDFVFSAERAVSLLDKLPKWQHLRPQTKSSHASVIFSERLEVLARGEDVGRHNALDKAIGRALLDDNLDKARIALLSSRVSFEMVQKVARAGIPMILALSRPTRLAIEIASRLKMTVANLEGDNGLYIYCGRHRLL